MKIDKGVPIPNKGKSKYPWGQMEIGDSCFVPHTVSPGTYMRYAPFKFTQRTVTEHEVQGTRVWRIA